MHVRPHALRIENWGALTTRPTQLHNTVSCLRFMRVNGRAIEWVLKIFLEFNSILFLHEDWLAHMSRTKFIFPRKTPLAWYVQSGTKRIYKRIIIMLLSSHTGSAHVSSSISLYHLSTHTVLHMSSFTHTIHPSIFLPTITSLTINFHFKILLDT